MKKKVKKIPKYKWGAQNTAAMITTVGNVAAGAAGVSQDSTEGNLMKGAGAGLSMIPTPYTQIAGAVLSTVGSLWGNTGSVNEHTGEINKASGISKWLGFGPSSSELEAKSNRVKNSIVDKEITEHLRANYYMDPNNSANNNIFHAAEGGIAPNLTPAYLDSREVVVSPDRGSAVRLPYAEGTDTIPAMVMPHSGVLSEDIEYKKGISFADLGDKIDKSFPDNTRAKQLLMQKALNAQEMKKVNKKTKNGIPAYENGENKTMPDLSDMFIHRQRDGKFVMQDINGNRYDIPEMMLPYIQGDEHGYWFGPQTGIGPSAGKWNGSMNFAKQILNSKNIAKLRNTMTKVLPKGAKSATPSTVGNGVNAAQAQKEMLNNDRTFQMWQRLGNKGGVPAKTVESNVAAYRDASKASRNLWELTPAQQAAANASAEQYIYDGMVKSNLPYWLTLAGMAGGAGTFLLHEATKDKQPVAINTSASIPVNTNGQTVATTQEKPVEPVVTSTEAPTKNEKKEVVVPKKSSINKPSSGKKTTTPVSREKTLTPEQIAESLRIADIGERHWLRGNVTEPKQSFASLASSTPTILKTQKLAPVTPVSNTTNSTATPNASGLDFDMLDYLNLVGPLANMFTPDAEAVRAHTISPVYGPTSYDVTPEMRQIASNRATANYDANQVNPNTGANMAFKAMTQLNSDKAAAAALSNKANVQNQLAFQNANIANNTMQFNANASHTAEVESAQNRAVARNIRRKGFGDFFTNIGKIRRDKRLSARDAGLYQAMLPYLEYGMTSDQLKKITELYA